MDTALYGELRAIALRAFEREPVDHTLGPTAVVHEAFLRLADQRNVDPAERTRFIGAAAVTMRRVLIDHARSARARTSRERLRPLPLGLAIGGEGCTRAGPEEYLMLDDALTKLQAMYPRAARLVELRFFGGLRSDDAAALIGISPRQAEVDWAFARAWLLREMGERAV